MTNEQRTPVEDHIPNCPNCHERLEWIEIRYSATVSEGYRIDNTGMHLIGHNPCDIDESTKAYFHKTCGYRLTSVYIIAIEAYNELCNLRGKDANHAT